MALTQSQMVSAARHAGLSPRVGQRNYGQPPTPLYGGQYALPESGSQAPLGGDTPEVMQGVKTTLDNSNAALQEIADNTKYMAVAVQGMATGAPGVTIPGAALANPQTFAPGTAAYQNPVVQATIRQATRSAQAPPPDKIAEATARQQTTQPTEDQGGTPHDKVTQAHKRQRARRKHDFEASEVASEGPTAGELLAAQGEGTDATLTPSPFATNLGNLNQPGSLRQRIAESMARRVQQLDIGPQLKQGPSGRYYRTDADVYEDEAGKVRRASGAARGQFASRAETEAALAPAEEVSKFKTVQTIQRGAQSFLGGISEGATVGSAAQEALGVAGLGGAAVGLGVAGAGVMAAVQAKNFMNSQRQQNAQWQSIMGGSNTEGYGERAQEAIFANTQDWFGGGIGAQQARQLYEGSAQIYGRDRRARDTAQDFGVKMWKQLGVDVSESLEMIRTAAAAGNDTLTGLADSLTNVSKAAQDAGVNADTARKGFQQQYQSATQELAGPAVAGTQGMLASAMTSMGRSFEGVSLATLNRPANLRAGAALSGISYPTAAAEMPRNPQLAADVYQNRIKEVTGNILNDQVRGYINQRVAGRKLSDAEWEDLTHDVQERFQIDPDVTANYLNRTVTQDISPAKAVEFAIRAQSQSDFNIGEKERQAAATRHQVATTQLTPGQRAGLTSGVDQAQASGGKVTPEGWKDPAVAGVIAAIGGKGATGTDTQREYISQVGRTGSRNPVVEKLLAEKTANYGGDTRYEVQTKDGKRYVTEQQLVRDYAGQAPLARIVKGPNAGRTVADALDIPLDEQARSSAERSQGEEAKAGDKTPTKGSIADPNANQGTGSTVRIEAGDQLRRWFTFMDASGNPVDVSRSEGGVTAQQPGYASPKTGNP